MMINLSLILVDSLLVAMSKGERHQADFRPGGNLLKVPINVRLLRVGLIETVLPLPEFRQLLSSLRVAKKRKKTRATTCHAM